MKELLRYILAILNAINSYVNRIGGLGNYDYYFVGPSKVANSVIINGNPQRIGLYVFATSGTGTFTVRIFSGSDELQIFVAYSDTPFALTYQTYGPICQSQVEVISDGATDITIIDYYKVYS